MTSVLNVDTIADKAGTGPVALTKQSAAKAWNNTNSTGTTINDSFNISSLGDSGTGIQDHNVTNAFDSANHVIDSDFVFYQHKLRNAFHKAL